MQVVMDRIEPLRAFRVAAAHEMRTAIGVAVEGEGHEESGFRLTCGAWDIKMWTPRWRRG